MDMDKDEQLQALRESITLAKRASSLLNGYLGGLIYNLEREENAQGVNIPNKALSWYEAVIHDVQRVTFAIEQELKQKEHDRKRKDEEHIRKLECLLREYEKTERAREAEEEESNDKS